MHVYNNTLPPVYTTSLEFLFRHLYLSLLTSTNSPCPLEAATLNIVSYSTLCHYGKSSYDTSYG